MSELADTDEASAPQPVLLHGLEVHLSFGQSVLHVPRDRYLAVVKGLLAPLCLLVPEPWARVAVWLEAWARVECLVHLRVAPVWVAPVCHPQV